jgi:hypothetical protein
MAGWVKRLREKHRKQGTALNFQPAKPGSIEDVLKDVEPLTHEEGGGVCA